MIPKRTLLSIYQPNQLRMAKLQFPLNMTLTRWINEAICEKLDRALPDTAGVSQMEEKPAPAFDPMAERRRLLRLAQGPGFVGPYPLKYRHKTEYLHAEHTHKKMGDGSPGIEAILEDLCIASNLELSPEEKGAILAAHAKEQRELAERARKQHEEAQVSTADDEDDFWGESDEAAYRKIKAKARQA